MSAHKHSHAPHDHSRDKMSGDGFEFDPVCGMKINSQAPKGGSYEYEGKAYFFVTPSAATSSRRTPRNISC